MVRPDYGFEEINASQWAKVRVLFKIGLRSETWLRLADKISLNPEARD